MTLDQANLLWIRAHVLLHARCADGRQWQPADLLAAFHTIDPAQVVPFEVWAQRAGLPEGSADFQSAPESPAEERPGRPRSDPPDAQTIRDTLAAQFGAIVPLYDPRAKGPLQWP